jgi:hypothetical protein
LIYPEQQLFVKLKKQENGKNFKLHQENN